MVRMPPAMLKHGDQRMIAQTFRERTGCQGRNNGHRKRNGFRVPQQQVQPRRWFHGVIVAPPESRGRAKASPVIEFFG
jgi:hypothetical protein